MNKVLSPKSTAKALAGLNDRRPSPAKAPAGFEPGRRLPHTYLPRFA